MKFNPVVFLLVVISAFLFSCSKERSLENTNGNKVTYLPHVDGAVWHYEDTMTRSGFTLKATDQVDTIEDILFYVYENIPDESPGDTTYSLIGRKDDAYYISGFLPQLGDEKLLVLKQEAAVNETWSQKVAVAGSDSIELVFKITKKGTSHTVLGHPYGQVIQVGIATSVSLGQGNSFLVPLGSLYYAAGIGIIQLDVDFQGQAPSVHLLLTDHEIP